MDIMNRLFGKKGEGRSSAEAGDAAGFGRPIRIAAGKEDSMLVHIDRIEQSEAISPGRAYLGLLLYAFQVPDPDSVLGSMGPIMQKALQATAAGDDSGTVLELKDPTGHRIPRGILSRILGIASFEGAKRNGELVIVNPGPAETGVLLSFIFRRHPDLAGGEMKPDLTMVHILKETLGSGGRFPSASAHEKIARMCRPDTPVSQIPRLFGMMSETLRSEGIPESNILDFIRDGLGGSCPACHRVYRGEEVVLLCEMKQSMRVLEAQRKPGAGDILFAKPGKEMDPQRLLKRLDRGICLNPSCNSAQIDLTWT